jgi:hypothetical protein
VINYTTFQDVIDHGFDYLGGTPSEQVRRDCVGWRCSTVSTPRRCPTRIHTTPARLCVAFTVRRGQNQASSFRVLQKAGPSLKLNASWTGFCSM